jgi:hypothetical protein
MSRPRTIQYPRRFLVTVEKDTHQDLIRLTALRSLDEQRTITLSEYVRDLLERETGHANTADRKAAANQPDQEVEFTHE